MGGATAHADDVRAHLTQMPYAEMVRQTNDMAALLTRADMAVVSGGITLYETICTGVPCIVLSQVEHQTETAEKFAARGPPFISALVNAYHRTFSLGICLTWPLIIRCGPDFIKTESRWLTAGASNGRRRFFMICDKTTRKEVFM